MPGPGFAVIDLETTGLFPGGHDRIVELAVVHVDEHGLITGQISRPPQCPTGSPAPMRRYSSRRCRMPRRPSRPGVALPM
jgi:DNA polymerase III epsilon subunit-like protein